MEDASTLRIQNVEQADKIQKFVASQGVDAVLDEIPIELMLVNIRKRVTPIASPLDDTPEKLAKNVESRFIATKMLDHSLGMFEGLSKLKTVLGRGVRL